MAPGSGADQRSGASARALVLSLFGLFVRPTGRALPTRTVVELLTEVGLDEANVRRTLTRLTRTELLTSTRTGRTTEWGLTRAGRELAAERDRQVFAPPAGPWDGQWSIVAVSVPDERRNDRYVLQSRLAWAGYGQLRPGLWVSPRVGQETEARQVLTGLGLAGSAHTFVGRPGTQTSRSQVAADAWDLQALADRYTAFEASLAGVRPRSDRARFAAELRLVTSWIGLVHRDPRLPRELLPSGWPGHRAAELFAARDGAWVGPARAWYAKVTD